MKTYEIEITELRVPLSRLTSQTLDDLKIELKRKRGLRRVTRRGLVNEALDLLFEKHGVRVRSPENEEVDSPESPTPPVEAGVVDTSTKEGAR